MENCKYCQAELAEDSTVCPACGKENAEPADKTEETVPVQPEEAAKESAAQESEEAPAENTAGEETAAAEASDEETVSEEPASEESAEEAPAQPEKKKPTPGKIALMVAVVVLLAAALVGLVMAGRSGMADGAAVSATVPADGNPEDATCKGTYTVTEKKAQKKRQTVVATIGDNQLTNGQLQVYYWTIVNNYLNSESGYYALMSGSLDYTKPLDTQISTEDENLTWQQFFLKEALNFWQLYICLAEEAEANGMGISQEDQTYLDNLATSLEANAAAYSVTVDELLRDNFGPGAAMEDYAYFQETMMRGRGFYQQTLADMQPDQADLDAYFAENEAMFASSNITKEDIYVDVRHILVKVEKAAEAPQETEAAAETSETEAAAETSETEATAETTETTEETVSETEAIDEYGYTASEWAACEAEAQAILDAWLEGEKTEDSFAALATEKTEDPGSQATGGLYENVYKGQMVEPFENWCFDAARQTGDYGLVKTNYGYHVMYFVGSEPVWTSYAENGWVSQQINDFLKSLAEENPLEVEYKKIVLGFIDLGNV